MKKYIIAFLSLVGAAFAQQGHLAGSYTASSSAPFLTLNRATTSQFSVINFKTAGATTGGWQIYGSNAANQTLNFYSYQAGAVVGQFTATGLNGTTIGATTPSTGAFTTVSTTGRIVGNGGAGVGNGFVDISFNGTTQQGIDARDSVDASGAFFSVFRKADATAIGSITRVTTTDAVAYNTTSDGRLKTNVRDFTAEDSGPIIDGLRPRLFDWRSGGTDAIGFIAQEENEVSPALARIGAVTVGDDDPEVITKQWQRSDAALVPILVAELKSLRARAAVQEQALQALQVRVAALEAE